MHSRTIDTPPAEMRQLVPKLTRLIEELARLRAETAAAVAAMDEAKRALQDAEQADRQAAADFARRLRKQKPKPAAGKAREALAQAETTAAALLQAVGDAQTDLESAIEEHRSTHGSSTMRVSRAGSGAGRRQRSWPNSKPLGHNSSHCVAGSTTVVTRRASPALHRST